MDENNNKHTRGVTLRELKDVRRVIQRITSKAFQENKELELAGRIAQLMSCWMKAWELDEFADLKERIERLEKEYKTDRSKGTWEKDLKTRDCDRDQSDGGHNA